MNEEKKKQKKPTKKQQQKKTFEIYTYNIQTCSVKKIPYTQSRMKM